MYQLLEHPDIACALRTGYPSWIRDRDVDDEPEDHEDIDGYSNEDTLYEERREAAHGW